MAADAAGAVGVAAATDIDVTFDRLGLLSPLLRAVGEVGYQEPAAIQRDTIPPALEGRDVIGCAQTGIGKTATLALLCRSASTIGRGTSRTSARC